MKSFEHNIKEQDVRQLMDSYDSSEADSVLANSSDSVPFNLVTSQPSETKQLKKETVENDEKELNTITRSDANSSTPNVNNAHKTPPPFQLKSKHPDSLPEETLTQMSHGIGADFSDVKIHSNSQRATDAGALAYTQGNDVHFAPGQYDPSSTNGQELIGHELTHVVQQREGRVEANNKINGLPLNDDKGLEKEADEMGAHVSQRKVGSSASSFQTASAPGITPLQRFKWPWEKDKVKTPEETEKEKEEFKKKNYGPQTYNTSFTSGSGFEATYLPSSNTLNVTVRAAVRFADTLTGAAGSYTSPNEFMAKEKIIPIINSLPPDIQSSVIPFFQWKEKEKSIHFAKLKLNLDEVKNLWEKTGLSLQVNEPGWEDVKASPKVNIIIKEGAATTKKDAGGKVDEGGSDHLQMEVVKQLNAVEAAQVEKIIYDYYEKEKGICLDTSKLGTRGVRAYLGNESGSKDRKLDSHNNFMSLESDRIDDPQTKKFNAQVTFENNKSSLSPEGAASLEQFLSNPELFMDNSGNQIITKLHGFASHQGSSKHNEKLVQERIDIVRSAINSKIGSHPTDADIKKVDFAQENNSDKDAETEFKKDKNYDPSLFRKVDIDIERKGRGGQNVLAHEFGHVFGLGDEYSEVGNGYNRKEGDKSTHEKLSRDAGVTGGGLVKNDDRMMSTGNRVEAAHYSTFADALKKLTSKPWKVV